MPRLRSLPRAIAAATVFLALLAASFRESVGTFRRMSVAESNAAKPLRLKVVQVAEGDTVERLAGRMAISDRPLERFRVLNGLGPNDRVKAGDDVKIVVE
jgi:predicted Zn-dependent protease